MEVFIQNFLEHISGMPYWLLYGFLFFSAFLQITFPPYPGDTVLVFGGYLGSTGVFGGNIPIFLSYLAGTLVTSYLLYELGIWKGEALLRARVISKYFPPSNQNKARKWVKKYGIAAFFMCKFIPGLNSIIIVLGGIFRYNRFWAYVGIGLASTFHNIILFSAGRAVGNSWDKIGKFLFNYNKSIIIIVIIAVIIYSCSWIFKKWVKRKTSSRVN